MSETYQILEQKLRLIQPHVQASNNCWEEAISQVDKLLRRNTDRKGTNERLLAQILHQYDFIRYISCHRDETDLTKLLSLLKKRNVYVQIDTEYKVLVLN